MEISTILTRLAEEKILSSVNWKCAALTGGTMSQVHFLQQEIGVATIIKINEANVTEAEANFLSVYQSVSILPNLIAVDSQYRYMVYTYIPGSTGHSADSKKELLQALVSNLINHYQPASSSGSWGWQDAPVNSWEQFLTEEVTAAQEILTPYLRRAGLKLAAPVLYGQNQNRPQSMPYLIHGDCGVHNFIFREKKLAGVIDPTPILGFPHYDVIYAFFSSPHGLTKETLDAAFSELTSALPDRRQLYNEVQIGLYQRLAICVKHHPTDLPAYLEAWEYWKEIISSESSDL